MRRKSLEPFGANSYMRYDGQLTGALLLTPTVPPEPGSFTYLGIGFGLLLLVVRSNTKTTTPLRTPAWLVAFGLGGKTGAVP